MSNNQVKLTAPVRSIERRSLPECWTDMTKCVRLATGA